ncbi:type II 3-dehydroquinate dehydratase [Rubrobacter tropicus]|uniref:3-dehydroquinate dehydratase n=1 Tax=Rubrobacter tropicus TaxID=2653851 RepID=A0A6G8Q9C6_9ACTN|nr:type II 3-dehydroquinate dehydratase [Rubrobacter tropicus]QIN83028.1 type II 3-dehydroquinate dehydratase [Rubrobacter tropicus]
MASVHVLNGVNLGSLGTRRPEVYGTLTLNDIERGLREAFPKVDFEFRQTDYEGRWWAGCGRRPYPRGSS